jgi:hypothetical protein
VSRSVQEGGVGGGSEETDLATGHRRQAPWRRGGAAGLHLLTPLPPPSPGQPRPPQPPQPPQPTNQPPQPPQYLDGDEVDVDLVLSEGEATYGAVTGVAACVGRSRGRGPIRSGGPAAAGPGPLLHGRGRRARPACSHTLHTTTPTHPPHTHPQY